MSDGFIQTFTFTNSVYLSLIFDQRMLNTVWVYILSHMRVWYKTIQHNTANREN